LLRVVVEVDRRMSILLPIAVGADSGPLLSVQMVVRARFDVSIFVRMVVSARIGASLRLGMATLHHIRNPSPWRRARHV